MTCELRSTVDASGIVWPAMRNHIPCMAHAIQLALGAVLSSLRVTGRTTWWEAHDSNQQFGEKESTDIGMSQTLRKEGKARINKVSAMRPGLAKIIEKVCISWPCERPDTDIHITEIACCINFNDTWSLEQVHWLSKSQCPTPSTTYYGCENTVEFDTEVASVSLPIMRIHPQVA